MPLKAEKTVGKVLISTTSRFVGELLRSDFTLTHAWPTSEGQERMARGMSENQLCRNFFVASFETARLAQGGDGARPPECTEYGKEICACLSVLYGKRFDTHGCFESTGLYRVPANLDKEPILNPKHPIHNHMPRPDLAIKLNLSESTRIFPVLDYSSLIAPELRRSFLTAARFYWLALQEFDSDPERAFLDLVTCGEVVAGTRHFEPGVLLDSQTEADLNRIEHELEDGTDVCKRIRGRLRQVKRRFVLALSEPLNRHFFDGSEAAVYSPKLTADNVEQSLEAAYDVRSQYVHGGCHFGVSIGGTEYEEVVQCYSSAYEEKFLRLVRKSTTFLGLERVLRFGLLTLLHRSGVPIDDRLAPDPQHDSEPEDPRTP